MGYVRFFCDTEINNYTIYVHMYRVLYNNLKGGDSGGQSKQVFFFDFDNHV